MTRIDTLEKIAARINHTQMHCLTTEERWEAEEDMALVVSAIESDSREFQVATIRHTIGYLLTD